jgi:hypothetical protein
MQCNIDQRGVKVRRVWGVMMFLVGGMLGMMSFWSGTWWLWAVAGLCVAAGIFAFWEARKKWCAVRAMGIKTPM